MARAHAPGCERRTPADGPARGTARADEIVRSAEVFREERDRLEAVGVGPAAHDPPLVAAVSGGEWARVTALAILAERAWLRGYSPEVRVAREAPEAGWLREVLRGLVPEALEAEHARWGVVLDAVDPLDPPVNLRGEVVGVPSRFYVRFDGPPSHESGRFLELETEDGRGVGPETSGAHWYLQDDGTWLLGPFGIAPEPEPIREVAEG